MAQIEHQTFPKFCFHKRTDARTLETSQEIKSFFKLRLSTTSRNKNQEQIFKVTFINLQCSQVDAYWKYLLISQIATIVLFVQRKMPCSSREKIQTQQTYFNISVLHKRKLRHCSSPKKDAVMHIGIYRRMFLFSKYLWMLDADKAQNCLQATFTTVLVCSAPPIPAAGSPQECPTSSLPDKTVQTTLLIFHEDCCALHQLQFQPSIFSGVNERE